MSDLETRVSTLEKTVREMEGKIAEGACKCTCCTKGECTCSPEGEKGECACAGECGKSASNWQDRLLAWVNNNPILAAFLGLFVLLVVAKIFR